ncbi:MAG TPA: LuxR C-terminal-related transcriptional regulator, partial [Baekduia sp.]|nr:LuxR C-terminal-related transcriptional regulator [Baekduia sp.]
RRCAVARRRPCERGCGSCRRPRRRPSPTCGSCGCGPRWSAVAPLSRAIALAERGGSRFERAEPRLRLGAVQRACRRPELAGRLEAEAIAILAACPVHGRLAGPAAAVAPAAPRRDGLTPNECAVLRLLPSGLSLREIGAELFLSVDTVKTHCRNIYAKLDAGSRGAAVARAREQGLLSPLRGAPPPVPGRLPSDTRAR